MESKGNSPESPSKKSSKRTTKALLPFGSLHSNSIALLRNAARTFIPEKYQALPHWCEIREDDPHNYPLRKPKEVFEELRNMEMFPIKVTHTFFPNAEDFDPSRNGKVKGLGEF